jgi:cytochrome c peroxidase
VRGRRGGKYRVWWGALLALAGALIVAGVTMGATGAGEGGGATPDASAAAQSVYLAQLDGLRGALQALDSAAVRGDSAREYGAYRRARAAYKQVEWWLATNDSAAVSVLNGPVVEESGSADDDADDAADSAEIAARGRSWRTPVGLQAVESQLYALDPRYRPGRSAAAINLALRPAFAAVDRARVAGVGRVAGIGRWNDRAVFDAVRAELARIDGVGLSGVDATRSRDGVRESGEALAGVCVVLGVYEPFVDQQCRRAAVVLRAGSDTLDRLRFLVREEIPLERAVAALREARGIPVDSAPHLWKGAAASVFDSGAFEPAALARGDAPAATAAEVAYGRRLFSDPALGGTSGRSCAFCHQPERAFTNGLAIAPGADRHAPSLLNVALQVRAFSDLRAATLEDQVVDVVGNPREMGGVAIDTAPRIAWALAAYERTLGRLDSRFDRAVRGDTGALTPSERRGFTVFMGKARCGTCHFAPLFNGVAPPAFDRTEVEVLGVPRAPDTARATADADVGRWTVTHAAGDLRAFRVPTVRDASVTGPYMHNGVYRTLEQVVDFYDRGGGQGIGARVGDQTLPPVALRLSGREKADLVAFLGALRSGG